MMTLKISAKGQVTLYDVYLEHLGVQPGDELNAAMLPDGRIELRAARVSNIQAVFGQLKCADRDPLSIDAMTEVIRKGWSDSE